MNCMAERYKKKDEYKEEEYCVEYSGETEETAGSESYYSFAWVYDTFMDNIPYDEWTEYLAGLLKEYGVSQGLLLDMGCGTGSVTERLAARGYDMIGIDNSEEMLMEARDKMVESGQDILYLLQDMRSFELYGTVAAAVSICDSMNYILEKEDLEQVFRLVNNYLDPKGIFIFDFNTPYKYRELLGDRTIAESRDNCSFIWENTFYEEAEVNIYDLTIFMQEEDDIFRRYQETHYQKGYTVETVCRLLAEAGLKLEAVYDAFSSDAPRNDSERVYFVAREQEKAARQ